MLNQLEKRIVNISYGNKCSHVGSCLSTVNILDHIYNVKKREDVVILGNSHAALALYVVLEKNRHCNAEDLYTKHGTHATRDIKYHIPVSGGPLGQAETVAVGMALADRTRDVYLVTSDGACAEGSVWEALRIASENRLENLKITVIANGYGGNGKIDVDWLDQRLNAFYPCLVVRSNLFHLPDWMQGLNGHYVTLDEDKYKEITNG